MTRAWRLIGREGASRPIGRRMMLALVAAGVLCWRQGISVVAAAMPPLDEEHKARLMALARARGELSVIVGFAVPGVQSDGPDASAPPDSAQEQHDQAAIARTRTKLLTDLGVHTDRQGVSSGPGIHGVKLFETIPFVALTVTPQALERVLANPLVESVQSDTAVPPL